MLPSISSAVGVERRPEVWYTGSVVKKQTSCLSLVLATVACLAVVGWAERVEAATTVPTVERVTAAVRASRASVIELASASKLVPRRLDGVLVPKSVSNLWPTAVMIDNHTAARPQAGLAQASVVYETLAEGGIPRFMAVFAQPNVPLIGPVRSTRPYFVRYAAEYRAGLAHAGGSRDGLILLNSLRMANIEGLKGQYAKYFYRRGSCVHCLFTDGGRLASAMAQAGYNRTAPTFEPWQFVPDPPMAKRRSGSHGVRIDLGAGQQYTIGYEYDRKLNVYRRSTGGRPHLDRASRRQLTAKNVVIMLVPKEKVLDRQGRIDLQTIGQGRAILLQNGFSSTITWRKRSTYGRTVFTRSDGHEVTFVRGTVWVEIVPRGHRYTLY